MPLRSARSRAAPSFLGLAMTVMGAKFSGLAKQRGSGLRLATEDDLVSPATLGLNSETGFEQTDEGIRVDGAENSTHRIRAKSEFSIVN